MTSRSKARWRTEEERRETSQQATDAFMVWAKGEGKKELAITLQARDWMIVLGSVTNHAAELVVADGDPELLLSLAVDLVAALRECVGHDTTDRIVGLVGAMISGIEQ